MFPYNIQCFRLILLTYIQKLVLKGNTNESKANFNTLKKIQKRNFQFIKYFSSPSYHLKLFLTTTLIHIILYLLTIFVFDEVFLVNRGCPIQYIPAGKRK
jgi:hypothetical protein